MEFLRVLDVALQLEGLYRHASTHAAGIVIGDRQIGPTILRYGTPELQRELLGGIISADYIFCLGMSEPEAGSDLAAVHAQ